MVLMEFIWKYLLPDKVFSSSKNRFDAKYGEKFIFSWKIIFNLPLLQIMVSLLSILSLIFSNFISIIFHITTCVLFAFHTMVVFSFVFLLFLMMSSRLALEIADLMKLNKNRDKRWLKQKKTRSLTDEKREKNENELDGKKMPIIEKNVTNYAFSVFADAFFFMLFSSTNISGIFFWIVICLSLYVD